MSVVTGTSSAAVILDVNETLFSLDALQPAFTEIGLTAEDVPLWFARTLRDGFALCASGDYRSFPEVAAAALISLNPDRLATDDAAVVLSAFGTLQPHPDVAEGLALLAASGVPMCTLSQGNADNVRRLFDSAGLSDFVTDHFSVDAVRRWKPAPQPYHYACDQLDLSPDEVTMVAVHSWDLHGARHAGLRTAWISRLEGAQSAIFDVADITGADLPSVARQIIEAA